MTTFPSKTKLLQNFLSCTNWEEKYIYIIELGKLLPKFPNNMKIPKYSIIGCQSHTWIALTFSTIYNNLIEFYGYSDASIVKGIITIIFSLYQEYDTQEIPKANVVPILTDRLQLHKHLTASRSQGIHSILNSIRIQSIFLLKQLNNNCFSKNQS